MEQVQSWFSTQILIMLTEADGQAVGSAEADRKADR